MCTQNVPFSESFVDTSKFEYINKDFISYNGISIPFLEIPLYVEDWRYLNEGADHIIVSFCGLDSNEILVRLLNFVNNP